MDRVLTCLGPDVYESRDAVLVLRIRCCDNECKCTGTGIAVTSVEAVSALTLMNELGLGAEEQPGVVQSLIKVKNWLLCYKIQERFSER